jgi:hypothetical protein
MVNKITLSKEQYEALKSLDKQIEYAKFEIERAKRVGIDMTMLENELNRLIELRNRILEEYKPEGVE